MQITNKATFIAEGGNTQKSPHSCLWKGCSVNSPWMLFHKTTILVTRCVLDLWPHYEGNTLFSSGGCSCIMPSALTPAGSTPAVVTVAAGNWRPLPFSDLWSHSWVRRERRACQVTTVYHTSILLHAGQLTTPTTNLYIPILEREFQNAHNFMWISAHNNLLYGSVSSHDGVAPCIPPGV